ncbi:MAG: D-tyrosyl-tRNA(Tyr) deacylase [Lachnospira sp.]|nr:D-tyrosyl-tRNA(Tyr) deacylase [Lachnospira sp.]
MRLVIQRVNHASVTVDDNIVGSISKGLLVLLAISNTDTLDMLPRYVEKLVKLRIFADENGKSNLSLLDVNGELLIVSQFTLYADCKKGHRPSFTNSAPATLANELYEEFIRLSKEYVKNVQHGIFGADMKVNLENDGPYTIVFDSKDM